MVLFRNQLLDRNVSDIINLHEYAAEFVGKPISVFDSVKIAKAILELNLLPAKLDIGKLTYEYGLEEDKYPDAKYFVIQTKNAKDSEEIQPKDVVLYGFDALVVYCQRINV
jgi:glyceraldehyde 3-phosphate dehydrogenase